MNRPWSGLKYGGTRAEAQALFQLASVHIDLGETDSASAALRASRDRIAAFGDELGAAITAYKLGEVQQRQGRTGEALRTLTSALQALGELGARHWEAHAFTALGHAQRAAGDNGRAADSWRRAFAIYTELGMPDGQQVGELLETTGATGVPSSARP